MPMSSKPDPLRWQQRGAFLVGITAAAGWLDALAPPSPMTRTLRLEAALLALFAVLWLAAGTPADHSTLSLGLIVFAAAAMGLLAAVALTFHLPNVATVEPAGGTASPGG
jgi:hypothetical protein